MKTIAFIATLLLWASIGQAQSLTASQAKAHEGENATLQAQQLEQVEC
jgi:hypothetical protein